VSVEYCTKLERGAISGASPEVIDALARALRLDEAERAHLFDLAQAAGPQARPPRRRNPKTWTAHTGLQWALDAVTAGPVFVRNGRLDSLARAFYMDVFDMPGQVVPNIARFPFLDERSREFYPTGTRSPMWPSRSCAPRPGATPAIRTSTTSSVNCRRAAKSSAAAGARIASATTAPG
jgi:hypothetical protein